MLLRKAYEENVENSQTNLKQFVDSSDMNQGASLFTNASLERVANGIRSQNYFKTNLQ